MPQTTCPTCKRELDVAEHIQGRWITCPRCLTTLRNPTEAIAEAPTSALHSATHRPEREATPDCPRCGREVKPSWRICPECETPLRRPRGRAEVPQLERDVQRDIHGVHWIALVLGGLLILGVLLFFLLGGIHLLGTDTSALIVAVLIIVGVLLAGLAAIAFGSRSKTVHAISAGMGGLLISLGASAVMGLILVALILAAIGAMINDIFTVCKCK